MKVFRDPVHNIIRFDKDADALILELIDTQEFQRLRQIKQLGLSSFTYPGAEHTRFAHSIGVTHLMRRFIDKICSLKEDHYKKYIQELSEYRMLALSAALLHDIGHGPFSHVLEKTTGVMHENWTIEIIRGDTQVNSVLVKHGIDPNEVADVIQRTHRSKAVVKLLSSQLDTDRIDYLIRDSMMTGAGYGSFDLEWMINVLRVGEYNGDMEVGLDQEKGLSIAEDFVMARYYMYKHVYFHKTTRSAEMLIDAVFKRAIDLYKDNEEIDLPDSLVQILTNKGQLKESLIHYLNLTDHTIWHYLNLWTHHRDAILRDLSSRFVKRKFFKHIHDPAVDDVELFLKLNEYCREKGIHREYYLLKDEAKSSSYKDTYILQKPISEENENEREASEQIVLFDHRGNGRELTIASTVINGIRNQPINIRRFFIPEEYKKDFEGGSDDV